MSKDKDSKHLLVATLIGGVVGVCVTSIYLASKNQSTTLGTLGRVALQVGEILDHQNIKATPFVKDVEKKIHKHEDMISEVLGLISSGIHLWEKIKKGR